MNRLVLGAIIAAVSSLVAQWAVTHLLFPQPDVEALVLKTCNEINQKLPLTVDGHTRFDATAAGPGKQITYFYTLIKVQESDLTAQVKAGMENLVRTQAAGQSGLKFFHDNGVNMNYVYRLPNGKEVLKFTVAP